MKRGLGARPRLRGSAAAGAMLAVGFALAGCAARIPVPTAIDAAAAQPAWPGTTEADLERGRTLYLRRCSGCHRLHAPGEVRPGDWAGVVAKMAPGAKLDAAERQDVLRYLVVLAQPH